MEALIEVIMVWAVIGTVLGTVIVWAILSSREPLITKFEQPVRPEMDQEVIEWEKEFNIAIQEKRQAMIGEISTVQDKAQSDSRKSRKKKKLPVQHGIWDPTMTGWDQEKQTWVWEDPPHVFPGDMKRWEDYFHQNSNDQE